MKSRVNIRSSAAIVLATSFLIFVPGDMLALPLPLLMFGFSPLQWCGLGAMGLLIGSMFYRNDNSRLIFFLGANAWLVVHAIVVYKVFALNKETSMFIVSSLLFLVVWLYQMALILLRRK